MVEMKTKRGVELDEKGKPWVYIVQEFKNGNGQPTQKIVRNEIRKKDLKTEKEELMENRQAYDEKLSLLNNVISCLGDSQYEKFKHDIKEGELKDFWTAYAHEHSIQKQIDTNQIKDVKSVEEYLEKEKEKINSALDHYKEYEEQLKEAEKYLKKKNGSR